MNYYTSLNFFFFCAETRNFSSSLLRNILVNCPLLFASFFLFFFFFSPTLDLLLSFLSLLFFSLNKSIHGEFTISFSDQTVIYIINPFKTKFYSLNRRIAIAVEKRASSHEASCSFFFLSSKPFPIMPLISLPLKT